jgi:hypothetical protein
MQQAITRIPYEWIQTGKDDIQRLHRSQNTATVGRSIVAGGYVMCRKFRAANSPRDLAEARALAGVWADLDWGDVVDQLDRIRHESEPTPPIEVL